MGCGPAETRDEKEGKKRRECLRWILLMGDDVSGTISVSCIPPLGNSNCPVAYIFIFV